MAVIDLKHAIVTIRDGATTGGNAGGTGAVNNASGYNSGATTMAIDGIAVTLAPGQTFTIASETGTPTHTITTRSPGSGNTTSVTFSPPLASTIADNAPIVFASNAGTPNSLEVRIGEGNLTYTEKRTIQYRRNRGRLDTVRQGDEEPVEVTFDFEWEFLRSDTGEPVTIEEALKKTGAASAWISSSSDPCEPYSVDIVIEYVPPCVNVKNEIIVLQDFRWESLDHNIKDGQVACKGQCNVTEAVVTRAVQVGSNIAPSELSSSEASRIDLPLSNDNLIAGRERQNPRFRESA